MQSKSRISQLKNKFLLSVYYSLSTVKEFFSFRALSFIKNLSWYFSDILKIKKSKNPNFDSYIYYPCLLDKTSSTPLDPIYFYQDTWAAKIIFKLKPEHHYDVGSSAKTIGLLSQFTPITMVDIRPIELELDNLFFKEGSILSLPFEDNSIESISSLCVVEHIGLGRYGDPIDAYGSEKAISELKRVVKKNGNILFSVPISPNNTVYFNAHRAFNPEYILDMFKGFQLVEEKYIYGNSLQAKFNPDKDFGVGLFHFKKV